MNKPRILVLDDDVVWLEQVPVIFEDECEVVGLPTIDQGLEILDSQTFDIVLLDLNFADDPRSGLDVFRKIHAVGCGADVIVISGETCRERIFQVSNAGVTRFISKPAEPDRVRAEVRKVLAERMARSLIQGHAGSKSKDLDVAIGDSPSIRRARKELEAAIRSGARDVLIQGETGTGKEVFAKALAASWGRSHRFIPVHCGAISDGLTESHLFGHVRGAFTGANTERAGVFEAAGGGVVFLDEIGEMPLHQQPKLLRVLQERKIQRVGTHTETPVSFRSISATHVDLNVAVVNGRFRQDLFYRIAQSTITVPPLRQRIDDLPALVARFLLDEKGSPRAEITEGAIGLLSGYDWPGNVRQLEFVAGNLACLQAGGVIREKDVCVALPDVAGLAAIVGSVRGAGSYTQALVTAERRRFEEAIVRAKGARDLAAKDLGLSRATFFRRAKELGLVKQR